MEQNILCEASVTVMWCIKEIEPMCSKSTNNPRPLRVFYRLVTKNAVSIQYYDILLGIEYYFGVDQKLCVFPASASELSMAMRSTTKTKKCVKGSLKSNEKTNKILI